MVCRHMQISTKELKPTKEKSATFLRHAGSIKKRLHCHNHLFLLGNQTFLKQAKPRALVSLIFTLR
jgi:hypothetical protein